MNSIEKMDEYGAILDFIRAIDKMNEYGAILDFIRANPGCSRGKIAAYTGMSPRHLTRALTKLHRAGKVVRAGIKRAATYTVEG